MKRLMKIKKVLGLAFALSTFAVAPSSFAFIPANLPNLSPFVQVFELPADEVKDLIFKTVEQMGYAFFGTEKNGQLVFVHHEAGTEALHAALETQDASMADLIGGNILLVIGVHSLGDISLVSVNAHVLAYGEKEENSVELKLSQPSFAVIFEFLSHLTVANTKVSKVPNGVVRMEVELPEDSITERLQLLGAFRPDKALYIDDQYHIMLLQDEFSELTNLPQYYQIKSVQDQAEYRIPRATCIVFWRKSENNPDTSVVYLLPTVLVERKSNEQKDYSEEGYDEAIKVSPVLSIHYKHFLQAVLNQWPYKAESDLAVTAMTPPAAAAAIKQNSL